MAASKRPEKKMLLGLPPPLEHKTEMACCKLRPKEMEALLKAAKTTGRTKSAMLQAIVEQWLREQGLLK